MSLLPYRWHSGGQERLAAGDDSQRTRLQLVADEMKLAHHQGGKRFAKNREMKEGPTMLLIIKDRFWEPTMFMKTDELTQICYDMYDTHIS